MNNRNTQLEKETVLAAEQLCHKPGRASIVITVEATRVTGGLSVDYCIHSVYDNAAPAYVIESTQALSTVATECLRKTYPPLPN